MWHPISRCTFKYAVSFRGYTLNVCITLLYIIHTKSIILLINWTQGHSTEAQPTLILSRPSINLSKKKKLNKTNVKKIEQAKNKRRNGCNKSANRDIIFHT